MSWHPVEGSGPPERRAVAIYHFDPNSGATEGQWQLRLTVGDVVVLREQTDCGQWYLGHLKDNPGLVGIFPGSHVRLLLPDGNGRVPPIAQEMTASLRDWGQFLKATYLEDDIVNLTMIKAIMNEVLVLRSALLSGNLTVEETRETLMKATTKIDFLNHNLGLDLVVRDESGFALSPDNTSAVSLYRQHVKGSDKIKNMMLKGKREDHEASNSFKLMLTVKNFVSSKVTEDVDLVMSIYEVNDKSLKPLCENYIVRHWSRNPNDPKDLERHNNLKVLFADISKNDITGKRLFLICNVISEGNFGGGKASSHDLSKGKMKEGNFRKPVGVAAVEITDLFTFKKSKNSAGLETEISAPFLTANDSESFESVFRKLAFDKKGGGGSTDSNRSLWISVNIMMGDATQAPLEVPAFHSFGGTGRLAVARKIGLPEVILPSDFRNDLYVTLISGEFSRLDKRSDRNVEVTVEVCDSNGAVIEESISGGEGCPLGDDFHSVVFYHESKPRWNEVTKVQLPVHQFTGSHLRFTFRHRSSNVSKEKSAPWAMSFLPLVVEHDKTAVRDGLHELLVYKIEKKFEFDGQSYLGQLPFLKYHSLKQKTASTLTLLPKDVFIVQTTLCSTKLTQNEGLLSLLRWRDEPQKLNQNLNIFNQKVNGREFIKFLADVLDALFSILTENPDSEDYDDKVFKSIIHVIHLITEDARYQQFVPVLDVYIQENFSATLAYNKLLVVLKECVESATLKPKELTMAMKSLKYIFKFTVQSRSLFAKLNDNKGREPFQQLLRGVLQSLTKLMLCTTQDLLQGQSVCLRHMVCSIPDLATVFEQKQLSEIIIQMIQNLPKGQLSDHKMTTLKSLVHSQLFNHPDCRAVILPELAANLMDVLETQSTQQQQAQLVPICTETLGDILDKLHGFEAERPGSTFSDISTIMSVLRTVIKSVANRQKDDRNIPAVVTNMIALLRIMTPRHYAQYIESFRVDQPAGRSDLVDFIMEVLGMFRDLLQNMVFSSDWVALILLQNSVLLQALRHFANTIRDDLKDPFEYQAWSNFFQCSVTFVTQPSLQLEKFSENKREKIQASYKDMRTEIGIIVKAMWFNAGAHKIRFLPDIVGPFLEMTLVPETELRKNLIPIFFDMMQCEYYSSKQRNEDGESFDTRRDVTKSKGNFKEFEREIILQLDTMIESGSGDEHYRALFRQIMMSNVLSHTALKDSGVCFVELVYKQLERLLIYRTIKTEESVENQMSCIVNLFEFYQQINYEELYIKYLKKLCALHERCQNWSEAASTLLQYSDLLTWSDVPLKVLWDRHRTCKMHRTLKEELYKDAINNYEKGKLWEKALQACKELVVQYEEETFEYNKLEDLYKKMAGFYKAIMTEMRPDPEYFRVAFYGRGFPAFLQNKIFVYRGRGFERLPDFQSRLLDQFPNAELMKTLQTPSDAEKEQPVQLLQINKVDPIMNEEKFMGKPAHQEIINYYKVNDVHRFMYSRPVNKGKDKENEFASLWIERTLMQIRSSFPGILQWFPLSGDEEVYELCPLDNALETMQKVNEDLRGLILDHQKQDPPLNPLSMKLNGIIDAAVMGGTAKYEQAFFSDSYEQENPDHSAKIRALKNLIAEQIPLLEVGLKIHDYKKMDNLQDLHNKMETMFRHLKESVEEKYGRRSCDITVRRVGGYRKSNSVVPANTEVKRSNGGNLQDSRLTASMASSTSDIRASMLNSQTSLDTTARSRMLSAIGITRKKSNASNSQEIQPRTSLTRVQQQQQSSTESMSNGASEELLLRASSDDGSNSPGTVLVTQNPSCRLGPSRQSSAMSRCISNGQFLLGGATNHSRSPSINSNRDSLALEELLEVADPPPVPPKTNRHSDPENVSISSLDEMASAIPTKHIVISAGKKKAPPPPPPSASLSSNSSSTPPMPPKKSPFKAPLE